MSGQKQEYKKEPFDFTCPKKSLLPEFQLPDGEDPLAHFHFEELSGNTRLSVRYGREAFFEEYFKRIGHSSVKGVTHPDDTHTRFNFSFETFKGIASCIVINSGFCCDPKLSAWFPEDKPIQKALLTNLKKREQELDDLFDTFKQYAERLKGVEIPAISPRYVLADDSRDIEMVNASLIKKSDAVYLLHRNLVMGINRAITNAEFLSEHLSSLVSELKSKIASMLGSEKDEKNSGKQVALASNDKEKLKKIINWLDFGLANLDQIKQGLSEITLFEVPPLSRRCPVVVRFYGNVPYTEYGVYGANPVAYEATVPSIQIAIQKVLEARSSLSAVVSEGLKSFGKWFGNLLEGSQSKQQITDGRDSKSSHALVVSKAGVGSVLSGDKRLPAMTEVANHLKHEKKTTNPVYSLLRWGHLNSSEELHGFPRSEFTDSQIILILEELLKDEEIVRKCFVDMCITTTRDKTMYVNINVISALTTFYGTHMMLRFEFYAFKPETRIKASIMICEAFKKKKIKYTFDEQYSIDNHKCVSVEEVLPKLEIEAARLETERLKAESQKAKAEAEAKASATSITTSQTQSAEQELAFKRYQQAAQSTDPKIKGEALREMGRCYETGSGVEEPDDDIALYYYKLAQEAGDKKATTLYSKLKQTIAEKPKSQPAAGGYHPGLQGEHQRREAAALKQDDNSVNKGHSSGPSSSSSQSTKK